MLSLVIELYHRIRAKEGYYSTSILDFIPTINFIQIYIYINLNNFARIIALIKLRENLFL